jgi:WD40 repeat protein
LTEALADWTVLTEGRHAVTAGRSLGVPRVWDIETARLQWTCGEPGGRYWGLALSPGGRQLAVAAGPRSAVDAGLRMWDLETGREVWHLPEHGEGGHGLTFSPDGRRLAVGGWGEAHMIALLDAATGRELFFFCGHWDNSGRAVFSPDGQRLAYGGSDGVIRIWDATPRPE